MMAWPISGSKNEKVSQDFLHTVLDLTPFLQIKNFKILTIKIFKVKC